MTENFINDMHPLDLAPDYVAPDWIDDKCSIDKALEAVKKRFTVRYEFNARYIHTRPGWCGCRTCYQDRLMLWQELGERQYSVECPNRPNDFYGWCAEHNSYYHPNERLVDNQNNTIWPGCKECQKRQEAGGYRQPQPQTQAANGVTYWRIAASICDPSIGQQLCPRCHALPCACENPPPPEASTV